jgi:hypothetical protein
MSMDIYVFLNKADFPSVNTWQTAIRDAGFPVELSGAFDPLKDSGFVPCKLREIESGFDYFFSPINDAISAYPGMAETVCRYDSTAVFVWRGRLEECAVALAAAATLTASSTGVLYDPQEDRQYDGSNVLKYAREMFEQISLAI